MEELEDIAKDDYELTGMQVGPFFPRLHNLGVDLYRVFYDRYEKIKYSVKNLFYKK